MTTDVITIDTINAYLSELTTETAFKDETVKLLTSLCEIDTTPNSDVSITRKNESEAFKIIEKSLEAVSGQGKFYPISPEIENHPAFSLLHYTKTAERPAGLDTRSTYEGRANYLFKLDHSNTDDTGRKLAVNAHIDVVSPYFKPHLEGEHLYGRGSCDDKGSIIAMIQASKIINKLRDKGVILNKPATMMFVIEEEPGGNGSLSLAIDKELKKEYDSMMVLECADNKLHPANRGAVWYKSELKTATVPSLIAASYMILEMEKEGATIKSESAHPLFPQRPVQTCHGMIGKFGEHPSRICGQIALNIGNTITLDKLTALIDEGVTGYIAVYGDKTKVINPETGKPKVAKHYELTEHENGFRLELFGSTGHMGAILENDGAITKMAYVIKQIHESESNTPEMILEGESSETGNLVLEGGQGFLPTHPIEQVMKRMADAAERGLRGYLQKCGGDDTKTECITSYDKLHNASFECAVDSPSVKTGLKAMELCGMRDKDEPLMGWTVSCDARLFATEYPELPVLTSGAGKLSDAHSDKEKIAIDELLKAIRFLVVFILMETGTIK